MYWQNEQILCDVWEVLYVEHVKRPHVSNYNGHIKHLLNRKVSTKWQFSALCKIDTVVKENFYQCLRPSVQDVSST